MRFQFNEETATQVAASFAERSGGRINYLLLTKLLYITDREALKRWGRPVIGGSYVNMDYGPVISPALDLITKTNETDAGVWASHFVKEGYDLRLSAAAGKDMLSNAEVELIEDVFSKFGHMDPFDLVHLIHKTFPEWADPQGTSMPIPVEEILRHVGKSPTEIESLSCEAASLQQVNTIFGV